MTLADVGKPVEGMRSCNYPSEVELGLNANVVAFFLILCAEDLEFGRAQRAIGKTQHLYISENGTRKH
jgi:hypothetical protein